MRVVVGVAIASVVAGAAHAQPAPESRGLACPQSGWAEALARLPGTVVVDRAELERRGWTRVSEALQATTWSASSIEGYTFDASIDGLPTARLAAAGMPDWVVFVDGQRVPVRAAGTRLLELLPVTIAQVERLIVSRAPLVANGRVASRGTIWVETSREHRTGVRGSYAIGNERGDPGPYRYTDLATPNVERLGPDAAGAVFLRAGRVDAQAGARHSSLNVTDEALLPRLHPAIGASGRELWQEVAGASGRVGVRAGCGGRHDLVAGRMRFTGALYQPTRDDWARSTLTHAGLSGHGALGGTTLRYAATASRLVVDTLPPDPSPELPRDRDMAGASAHASRTMRGVRYAIDAAAGSWSAGVPRGHIGAVRSKEASLLAGALWSGARATASVTGGAARAAGTTGPQVLASVDVAADAASRLRLEAGYDGVARDGEAWSELAPADAPTLSWVGASWTRARGAIRASAGGELRRATRWRVRTLDDDAIGDVTTFGADGELSYATDSGGVVTLRYRLDLPTSGDAAVDAALAATPRHQLRAAASTARLPGNFRVSGFATLRSASTWPAAGADTVARELPALVRIDATVEKWFWRDRGRVFAAARNLFDREERHHPAGAHFAFRVHVGAEVDLR